jgi:hypothetical protein
MKNIHLKNSLKWGANLAGINFVIALLTPNPLITEPLALMLLSPVLGLIGGVVIYLLNFVTNEAVRFVEYQTTKVEGVSWDSRRAVRRVRLQTIFGLSGATIGLLVAVLSLYFGEKSVEAMLLAPTAGAVFGFIFSVILFCTCAAIVFVMYLVEKALPTISQLYQKLKQRVTTAYHKWKSHDYRS